MQPLAGRRRPRLNCLWVKFDAGEFKCGFHGLDDNVTFVKGRTFHHFEILLKFDVSTLVSESRYQFADCAPAERPTAK